MSSSRWKKEQRSDPAGEGRNCTAANAERWSIGQELWHSFGGYRMRYLRLGPTAASSARHPPLVLIHGLLGYSFSWRHNLEVFARERAVYAVDLPGIGYSDRPQPGSLDLSLQATANRMLEWLSGLGVSRIDLLGTSHGGALAMMMAALSPRQTQKRRPAETPLEYLRGDLIGRLVLAAPVNPWSRSGRFRIAFLKTPLGRWMAQQSAGWQRARRIAIQRLYADQAKIAPDTVAGYSRMMDVPGTMDYCLDIVKTWNRDMGQLKERLESIDIPALLIWGDRDGAVPPGSGRELAANLKRSELVIMPGGGHMPYEEAPEEFNRLVLDYLDRALSSS